MGPFDSNRPSSNVPNDVKLKFCDFLTISFTESSQIPQFTVGHANCYITNRDVKVIIAEISRTPTDNDDVSFFHLLFDAMARREIHKFMGIVCGRFLRNLCKFYCALFNYEYLFVCVCVCRNSHACVHQTAR